ncbi:MAG TPA: tetratricopeptide repeat protein [Pyrinomonadaceae bacterium]|jgi:cytochrome c-type biogenesis protein CcmH/NrfG
MFKASLRAALVAAALALVCGVAAAQLNSGRSAAQPSSGQINGQVRFADTRQPAYNVQVTCDAFTGGIMGQMQTDRSGRFVFNGLGPAQFIIRVQAPGYLEERQNVELQTQPNAYLQISLRPDPNADPAGIALREYQSARALLLSEKKLDPAEAVRHLERAVELKPDLYDAQLLLGTTYMDMKQWDKAEQALHRAETAQPKAAAPHFALGEVYRRQKKYKEAEAALLAGLKLDEKSVQGHITLGRVYYEQNDLAKAGPQVGTALQLDPKLAEGHLLAGNILLKARQAENALAEFEAYLVLAPNGEYAPQARELVQKIKQALPPKK